MIPYPILFCFAVFQTVVIWFLVWELRYKSSQVKVLVEDRDRYQRQCRRYIEAMNRETLIDVLVPSLPLGVQRVPDDDGNTSTSAEGRVGTGVSD